MGLLGPTKEEIQDVVAAAVRTTMAGMTTDTTKEELEDRLKAIKLVDETRVRSRYHQPTAVLVVV